MVEQPEKKMYRIGPYAYYLGVTPDLLKYYEQFQLVESVPSESGYRYYPFSQSPGLLCAMTLRGYGIPLKEIDVLLHDDEPETIRKKLDARAEEMAREINFQQTVLEDHRRFSAWMERMAHRERDWRVAELEPFFFLPHSRRYDFLSDERIYAILKDWTGWMPVVKSCQQITCPPDQPWDRDLQNREFFWGLMIPQSLAQACSLPLNDVVERIPGQKWFICDYAIPYRPDDPLRSLFSIRVLQEELEQRQLTPLGNIYKVSLLQTHINDRAMVHFGYYLVPVR